MLFSVEYTDTFGGEANYSWVRRGSFEAPEDASQTMIVRRAKAILGLTGWPMRTEFMGDMYKLTPASGCCTVAFITRVD